MKKVFLAIMLMVMFVTVNAQSNYEAFKSLYDDRGYTLVVNKYSYLSEDKWMNTSVKFETGYTYVVIGMCDDGRVTGTDLVIYNGEEKYDEDIDHTYDYGRLEFSPIYSRNMSVWVKNCETSTASSSLFRILVFRKLRGQYYQ